MLTPKIMDYCQRCSPNERKSIVAFCCHLAFTDRSVLRLEVEFVQAVAAEMDIPSEDVIRMARKARRRRLKIKKPKTSDARKLMFHLALLMSAADQRVDAREREAIERLANQLRIPEELVQARFEKLSPSEITDRPTNKENATSSLDAAVESLANDWVAEDFEAILFDHPEATQREPSGEMEYSRSQNGRIELSLEIQTTDLSSDEIVSVVAKDNVICKWIVTSTDLQYVIRAENHETIPAVAAGDTIEIHRMGERWLTGTFE